jgi:DNA-binding IclR family transcriptional regulator
VTGRTSPPTQRVVEVLDFLARHPHDRFGISELARRTGQSKPTCLGIVTTLAESGYLLRDAEDKTYRLGPSLIALGHVAQESMRVGPSAREELRALSSAYGTTAALAAIVDDRITLLELVDPPGADFSPAQRRGTSTRESVRVGQSYPFAPPVGLMFVLWDDDALRDWLAREPTIPLRTGSDRLDRVVAECRASGYLVERLTPGGRRLYALMAGMSSTMPQELRALLGELISDVGERVYLRSEAGAQRQRHDISVISAPVYDHYGRQTMVVSLQIGRALTDAEIVRHAKGVMATAHTLTTQLGGLHPPHGAPATRPTPR